jgi:hypothetical protein
LRILLLHSLPRMFSTLTSPSVALVNSSTRKPKKKNKKDKNKKKKNTKRSKKKTSLGIKKIHQNYLFNGPTRSNKRKPLQKSD